ncbi:MAG: HEAT repeat domain-containing protein [Chloroflexi bacterium]|nr:HEAT repeat domain-containing protein [Chloroflexota bacterium]
MKETRQQLVARLAAERDPDVLREYVHHAAWQVRWTAIESLGKSGSPDAEAALLEVLQLNADVRDLPFANAALRQVGSKAAVPALTALIHHPNEDVKASAIGALGVLGDASVTPTYLDALSNRSWVAKWYAMEAISRGADERAIGPVCERVRSILRRERKVKLAGTTELMYALEYLARWRSSSIVVEETIAWVRQTAIGRLRPEERSWFETTFGDDSSVEHPLEGRT